MNTRTLLVIVICLSAAVVLAATNPTTQDYEGFLEATVAQEVARRSHHPASDERASMIRALLETLLQAVIRPNTVRRNYGLFSLFETRILDTDVLVLGVGTAFWPLSGVEEAIHQVEHLAKVGRQAVPE